MTLIENVMLGAQGQSGERIWPNWIAPRLVAREERACRDKAMDLPAFVKLDRLAREHARVLSGGERKLLELARALMAEPTLLLLDEPAAGVNPSLLEVIVERVVEINRRGVTLLVIEHNMDVIVRLCGRVFVMTAGKLLCEGRPEAVVRDPRVIERISAARRHEQEDATPCRGRTRRRVRTWPAHRQRRLDRGGPWRDRRRAGAERRREIDAHQGGRRPDPDQRRKRDVRRSRCQRITWSAPASLSRRRQRTSSPRSVSTTI
jgi:ABC-type multidrug transport system ATPase subunit